MCLLLCKNVCSEKTHPQHYIFSVPDEWMSLGMIEGEQHPCPGLAFIPKDDSKPTKHGSDLIQALNGLYEVSDCYGY